MVTPSFPATPSIEILSSPPANFLENLVEGSPLTPSPQAEGVGGGGGGGGAHYVFYLSTSFPQVTLAVLGPLRI